MTARAVEEPAREVVAETAEAPLGSLESETDAIVEEQAAAREAKTVAVAEEPDEPPAPAVAAPESPLLPLEEAAARIDPAALEMLEEKFRGKLAGVRRLDARDALF